MFPNLNKEVQLRKRTLEDGNRLMGGLKGLIEKLNNAGLTAGMDMNVGSYQSPKVITGRIVMPAAMETPEVEVVPSATTPESIPNPVAQYHFTIDFHETTPRMSIQRVQGASQMYECFDLRADDPHIPTPELVQKFGEFSENVTAKMMPAPEVANTYAADRAAPGR